MSETPKQLSLFDQNTIDDERPLPLIVAEQWDFPLAYHSTNTGIVYSIIDWMAGIGSSDLLATQRHYQNIGKRFNILKMVMSYVMQYNGETITTDFTDDHGLYRIAEDMRVTKKRPALKAIKDYLAESGVFADEVRRNPEKAIEQIESYAGMKRKRQIDRYVNAGYGDHPEVKRLQMRDTNIATFKSLKQSIARVCENPQWGRLINAEYEDLFGEVTSTLKALLETDNIRDALQMPQLTALTFAEQGLKVILDNRREMSNDDIRRAIEMTFVLIGQTLREICTYAGVNPITNQALLEAQS